MITMTSLIACKICYEEYDDSDHQPYIGTCGHTICEYCKNKIGTTKCSCCNKEEAFVEAKKNHQLQEFVKAIMFAVNNTSETLVNMDGKLEIKYVKSMERFCSKNDVAGKMLILKASSIECKACSKYYDDSIRQPCIGKCGHSICKPCKEKMSSAQCPNCKKEDAFIETIINYQVFDLLNALKFVAYDQNELDQDGNNVMKNKCLKKSITLKVEPIEHAIMTEELRMTNNRSENVVNDVKEEKENTWEVLKKYFDAGENLSDTEKKRHLNNVSSFIEEFMKGFSMLRDVRIKIQNNLNDTKIAIKYVTEEGKAYQGESRDNSECEPKIPTVESQNRNYTNFGEGLCSKCGTNSKKLRICVGCATASGILAGDGETFSLNATNVSLEDALIKARNVAICADCTLDGEHKEHNIGNFIDLKKSVEAVYEKNPMF